jgi:hypothetical protein
MATTFATTSFIPRCSLYNQSCSLPVTVNFFHHSESKTSIIPNPSSQFSTLSSDFYIVELDYVCSFGNPFIPLRKPCSLYNFFAIHLLRHLGDFVSFFILKVSFILILCSKYLSLIFVTSYLNTTTAEVH